MSSIFKRLGNFMKKEYSLLDPKISVGGKRYGINPFGSTATATGDLVGGGNLPQDVRDSLDAWRRTAGPLAGAAAAGSMFSGGTPVPGSPAGAGAPATGNPTLDMLLKQMGGGGLTAGDWLKAGGSAIGAGLSAYDAAQQRAQQKQQFEQTLAQRQAEFNRTQADTEGQQAVAAETRLNKAPLADRAQAVLLQHMAPQAFRPRDITSGGTAALTTPATGTPDATGYGMAEQNYTPGQGGVNTDVLELLKKKLTQSAGLGG